MHDELGNRLKTNFEDRTRYLLPRRSYTIIRADGKSFHSFTKGFKRPFDETLMGYMDRAAAAMCQQIMGARFAYVQSDEISILVTDFGTIHTDAWFQGNIQKMASVSASMATAAFTKEWLTGSGGDVMGDMLNGKPIKATFPMFDARVFTIPDPTEVENYFIWRQQDATRNSIQMAARYYYSHKQCDVKNTGMLQEMLFQKGVNWNDYSDGSKRGRIIMKKSEIKTMTHKTDGTPFEAPITVQRAKWVSTGAPIFTQERTFLGTLIPMFGEKDETAK
jgi:tRNA(His) 5'-end guanylyltransferase